MTMFVKKGRTAGSMIILGCLLPLVVQAEPVDERELGRWVPSFAIVTGLNAQNAEGTLGTGDVLGPQDTDPTPPNPQPQILPGTPTTARSRMMTPFVGLSLEVMTPGWKRLPGSPRAYVRGDVSYAFGPDYNLPLVGQPGPFVIPATVVRATERSVLGQGGYTRTSVEPLLVTAGAGLAFTVDAWDRALRIKPSVEYMREEIRVEGLVRRVVALTNFATDLSDFRPITLASERNLVYHGLGPGIELELDTRRAGPFVLSVYLGAKGWKFFDNQKFYLTDANQWAERATWTFLKNEWAFGGNLGLRFRWVPE